MSPLATLNAAIRDLGRLTPCQYDPEAWYPVEIQPDPRVFELCRECPVKTLCRAAGRTEQYGIWGGVRRDPRTWRLRVAA
jgi:MoaA/NifB/PqqE/SkfB family radical SAM enzyme